MDHLIVDEDVQETDTGVLHGIWCSCGKAFVAFTFDRALFSFHAHC